MRWTLDKTDDGRVSVLKISTKVVAQKIAKRTIKLRILKRSRAERQRGTEKFNIPSNQISKRRERKEGREAVFEEIIADNFQCWIKTVLRSKYTLKNWAT